MAYSRTPKRKKIDEEFVSGGRQSPLQKAKKKIAEKKKTTKGKKILAKMYPKKEVSTKKEGWYPGKYAKKAISAIASRRKKRKSENKWVLGEKLTKAGRKRATARQAGKRLGKAGIKVTAKEARLSGKIRKGALPLKKEGLASSGKLSLIHISEPTRPY